VKQDKSGVARSGLRAFAVSLFIARPARKSRLGILTTITTKTKQHCNNQSLDVTKTSPEEPNLPSAKEKSFFNYFQDDGRRIRRSLWRSFLRATECTM
jgi:hypothetical protein